MNTSFVLYSTNKTRIVGKEYPILKLKNDGADIRRFESNIEEEQLLGLNLFKRPFVIVVGRVAR